MSKVNCWEFKKCGLGLGGDRVGACGLCPAADDGRLNGINDGHNGGRACWAVTGTFCSGAMQGRFSSKVEMCLLCDFYKLVCYEQGKSFQGTAIILDCFKRKSQS